MKVCQDQQDKLRYDKLRQVQLTIIYLVESKRDWDAYPNWMLKRYWNA